MVSTAIHIIIETSAGECGVALLQIRPSSDKVSLQDRGLARLIFSFVYIYMIFFLLNFYQVFRFMWEQK